VGARAGRSGHRGLGLTFLVALPALLLLVLAGVVRAGGEEGEAPRLAAIRFTGNRHLSDGELRSVMRLRQPAWWRPFRTPRYAGADFLTVDLRAVEERYRAEGFPFARVLDAEVRYNASQDQVRLTVTVDEGPRIRLAGVRRRGLREDWEKDLAAGSPLRPGAPLSWPAVLAERDRVSGYCSDRGFALGRTELSVRYDADTAEVVIDVDPGERVLVDSITVSGLTRTRAGAVLREVQFKRGDPLTARRIQDSRRRLLDTGLFTRVRLVPQFPDSTKPAANLKIELAERKPAWYGVGAGYSSSDQVRLLSEWGMRNLDGRGRRLTLAGKLYYSLDPKFRGGGINLREGVIQADLLEPWLFGRRLQGIASPYVRWLREEGFEQHTIGYDLALRRELSRWTRVSVGHQSKHVRTTQKDIRPRYTTRFVNLDLAGDWRDNVFDPTRGPYVQSLAEYAGGLLGGSNQFGRLTLNWQGYHSPQPGWVIAARARLGAIDPLGHGLVGGTAADTMRLSRIPWEERFRLGGGNTVRGYGEGMVGRRDVQGRAIGGLAMALLSFEVRFPLVSIVQGALFVDTGNVWADPKGFSLARFTRGFRDRKYEPLNAAWGIGVGLRVKTPVGPFRFDYGFKVGSGRGPDDGPGNLHVALGQAF
jgi:outer membrane protein assembly complex protein YaeT